MTLSEELIWRGFVNQTTLDELSLLDTQKWTFYHGFDASADSQAVGNLAAMMLDRVFLRHGHKAVLLAGGATSLIGDPGGKDKERPMQDEATIAHNVAKAEEQLKKIFAGYDFTMVNNLDWFKDMNVLEFLRDVGKHFSMTPLVQRDYIATRMGEGGAGISYTEFSYTLLQGYDYLHLHQKYGVNLQLAGSDQWGNSLSGVELTRRVTSDEVHVLTLPLVINKATGKKFGKSEEGAVWLDPGKTTPTQFYQFWINLDDDGVEDYLKIYTELDKNTIEAIMADHQANPSGRSAQRSLAREVTELVHGSNEMKLAEAVTEFLTGAMPIGKAGIETLDRIRKEIPAVYSGENGSVIEALTSSGLVLSNTEARRLLQGNAISVNGQKIARETFEPNDFQNGRAMLRRGKAFKDSALVELQ
jgi:tyrosyl-tRNA synthetase